MSLHNLEFILSSPSAQMETMSDINMPCNNPIINARSVTNSDKFISRSGQMGTIGFMISHVDLPLNENGLIPDIIINNNYLTDRTR